MTKDSEGPLLGWSLQNGVQQRKLDELLEFPCDFAFKVVGPPDADFESDLRKSIGDVLGRKIADNEVSFRASKTGKYRSITVKVTVKTSQDVYDVYAAISEVERVKYVL